MFLHNIPEGLGVYLSALANFRLGIQLSMGILLHNIPEGMAVAIPIWVYLINFEAATGSAKKALFMTFLNGLGKILN